MPAVRLIWAALLMLGCVPGAADAQSTRETKPIGVRHTFTLTFRLSPTDTCRNVTLKVAVPRTISPWQTIEKIEYSHKPAGEKTKGDARYAEFKFPELKAVEKLTITITARLGHNDWRTASRRKNRLKTPPPAKSYTAPEKFIESTNEEIVAAAKKIGGNSRLEQVRGIMQFVVSKLRKPGYDPTDRGAAWALKRGTGDCTEYSDLFVALCRAKGIPARCCEGFLNYTPRGDTPKHIWAEVYFDRYGWVAFDPLHVDLRKASLLRIRAHYLKLTSKRNDGELDSYHFYSYRYGSGKLRVTDTFAVRKEH